LTVPWSKRSEEESFAAIKAALESGCNYFNGGIFYGTPEHNSLTLLQKYFQKYPEDADKVVLNIKGGVGSDRRPLGSKEYIASSIENAVKLLGPVGRIDQFEPARKDLNHDYETETLSTIESFVKSGKIGGIACSEINVDTLRSAAKSFNITSLEIEVSLFSIEPLNNGLLQACGELNIPVLAYCKYLDFPRAWRG
jgi:pyridoxine 4-dehydrogenase